MIVVIRILLLLLPVVGLLFWIRSRARRSAEGEFSDEDVKHLRLGLVGLVVLLLIAGFGIRMTESSGGEGEFYVPARVENGKTIPGHFVTEDPDQTAVDAEPDESTDDEDGDDAPS